MKREIYCVAAEKGVQDFYIQVGDREFFLFSQKYYKGVRNYFENGVDINSLSSLMKNGNTAVCRTAEKIPAYIKFIEREYGVAIFDNTMKNKQYIKAKKSLYARGYDYEIA